MACVCVGVASMQACKPLTSHTANKHVTPGVGKALFVREHRRYIIANHPIAFTSQATHHHSGRAAQTLNHLIAHRNANQTLQYRSQTRVNK